MEATESKPARRYRNPTTGYAWHEVDVEYAPGQRQRVKIIDSPGVYMTMFPSLHEGGINEFLKDHEITEYSPFAPDNPEDEVEDHRPRGAESELGIELAGRICYMSYNRPRPGGLSAFLENLKNEGHGSVFEHPHWSFILSGVSRNLTLEANRCRFFNISQLSGRFVNPDEVGFIGDPEHTPAEAQQYAEDCVRLFRRYEDRYEANYKRFAARWLEKNPNMMPSRKDETGIIKKARERARDILPGSLETRVMYTINSRAIRGLFETRCAAGAAWEIRRVMNKVFRMMKGHAPKLFNDYTETDLGDNTFAITTPNRKI